MPIPPRQMRDMASRTSTTFEGQLGAWIRRRGRQVQSREVIPCESVPLVWPPVQAAGGTHQEAVRVCCWRVAGYLWWSSFACQQTGMPANCNLLMPANMLDSWALSFPDQSCAISGFSSTKGWGRPMVHIKCLLQDWHGTTHKCTISSCGVQ